MASDNLIEAMMEKRAQKKKPGLIDMIFRHKKDEEDMMNEAFGEDTKKEGEDRGKQRSGKQPN